MFPILNTPEHGNVPTPGITSPVSSVGRHHYHLEPRGPSESVACLWEQQATSPRSLCPSAYCPTKERKIRQQTLFFQSLLITAAETGKALVRLRSAAKKRKQDYPKAKQTKTKPNPPQTAAAKVQREPHLWQDSIRVSLSLWP